MAVLESISAYKFPYIRLRYHMPLAISTTHWHNVQLLPSQPPPHLIYPCKLTIGLEINTPRFKNHHCYTDYHPLSLPRKYCGELLTCRAVMTQ